MILDADLEFFYNPEVQIGAVLTAMVILIVSGILAGYFPAKKAASIPAVVAMKD